MINTEGFFHKGLTESVRKAYDLGARHALAFHDTGAVLRPAENMAEAMGKQPLLWKAYNRGFNDQTDRLRQIPKNHYTSTRV